MGGTKTGETSTGDTNARDTGGTGGRHRQSKSWIMTVIP